MSCIWMNGNKTNVFIAEEKMKVKKITKAKQRSQQFSMMTWMERNDVLLFYTITTMPNFYLHRYEIFGLCVNWS